jgi:hypothetical protein
MAARELQLRPGGEFLAHLECGPGEYGHASALEFADRLRRRAEGGALVLLVLGEPLSGKSTFVQNLLRFLIGPPDEASQELQFKLIRWGDAMRAQRHLGLLPADRLPGDLSAEEFARLSAFVGEQVHAAVTSIGSAPGLVIAEAPGCTAVVRDGRIEGLDRGLSTARALVDDERVHIAALVAESRLREQFVATRETAPGDATNARQATPLAANRINQQLTALVARLHAEGRLSVRNATSGDILPELERDTQHRDEVVFRQFLPYLLSEEIGVPSERALVARNVLFPELLRSSASATLSMDQFDYIKERYGI